MAEELGISAAELAERLELPRQTVHRNVRALEEMGFLIRAISRDRYEIGPMLLKLANATLISSHRRGPWRAVLQDVVDQTGESCNVAVLDGCEITYIDRVECQSPLRVQLAVGSRVPIYCTAIGKVLLANLQPTVREKMLKVLPLRKFTPSTITDRRILHAQLDKVRKQGYAINSEEFIDGILAVAVPISNERDEVIAAVAVHAPVLRVRAADITRFLPVLNKAARRLSALHRADSESSKERLKAR
jgi:DNA-binding IclR family transcriptional regulator